MHKQSIIKAIRYIEDHLDSDLSLENVSGAGAYSPFHFHRIFRLVTGETLQNYIARRRAEKGALYLAMRKEMSITDVYHQSGFSSHSAFNKAFKKYYGTSPSGFRRAAPENFHRIAIQESKKGQRDAIFSQYICNTKNLLNWMNMNLKIEVHHLPEMHLAAVMSLGIAHVESSFSTLINWARSKNLFPRDQVKMLSVYHDSFKVTPPDKVRIHACMLLDEPLQKQEGEVFPETVEAGKFIIGSGEVTLDDFEQCWVSLFLWMKEHNYLIRKAFPFEIYHTNFREHPEGKMTVDFCIPIQ